MEEGALIRGAIQVGEHAIPFGPIIVGSSTEWAFDPNRLSELRSVSAQTGGRELTDLSKAWLRPNVIHRVDLRLPLIIIALLLLILDALITRTGWKLPLLEKVSLFKLPTRSSKKTRKPKLAKTQTTPNQKEVSSSPPEPKQPEAARSSRFDRAKRRK